jgi:hypothetical protein
MPMQLRDYPPGWRALSHRLRFERAQGRCEWCGAEHGKPHLITGSRVVLTCAHLDHNPASADETRLRALCQRCHNRLDAPLRRAHARVTRIEKRGGQLPLPLVEVTP